MLETLGRKTITMKILVTISVLFVIFILLFICLKLQRKSVLNRKTKTAGSIEELLSLRFFETEMIHVVSDKFIIALNNDHDKIAIVENFIHDHPEKFKYFEILAKTVIRIEYKAFNIKLYFRYKGEEQSIYIPCFSKDTKLFFHEFVKKIFVAMFQNRYPEFKFDLCATSDLECRYIWVYDSSKCTFGYCLTGEKPMYRLVNLRKDFFTIDINYNYLELPVLGELRQLYIFEKEFLYDMYKDLCGYIKKHIAPVLENRLYYDNYSEIIYLTNGVNTLQSVVIDRIEDVVYKDNRLSFALADDKKIINFFADKMFIEEFEKFVTNYNLRKIAKSFDYKSDKLINASPNTKFIFDTTRDRIVYCANLNKFHAFSFMTLSFLSIKNAEVIKNATMNYVRITTKNDEIIDVSCVKREIAQYIKAQIDIIIAQNS